MRQHLQTPKIKDYRQTNQKQLVSNKESYVYHCQLEYLYHIIMTQWLSVTKM